MVFSRDLPHSFSEALRVSREILSTNHDLGTQGRIESESELIVTGAHRLATGEQMSRSDLYFRMNDRMLDTSAEKVLVLSQKRAEGKLLQHVLGYAPFLAHEYQVSAEVLIPRPETEILVSEALKILMPLGPSIGIEVGLGSGIISVELLSALPKLKMVASEISLTATEIAKGNARSILVEAVGEVRLSVRRPENANQVLEPFADIKNADFLISNPPYLDRTLQECDSDVLSQEPQQALFPAGSDPLYFYKKIEKHSSNVLKKGAYIFLEVASERAMATRDIFDQTNWESFLINDLNGRERVLVCRRKN